MQPRACLIDSNIYVYRAWHGAPVMLRDAQGRDSHPSRPKVRSYNTRHATTRLPDRQQYLRLPRLARRAGHAS